MHSPQSGCNTLLCDFSGSRLLSAAFLAVIGQTFVRFFNPTIWKFLPRVGVCALLLGAGTSQRLPANGTRSKRKMNMKSAFRFLLLAVLVSSLPAFAQKDDDRTSGNQNQTDVTKRLNDAAADLNRLTSAGDNNIPQSILADAKCIAIVPSLVKGGFIVGAQHGRGVATCRVPERKGWSAPAFFVITGGSWGAQIGVEGVDLVMLFMNNEGAEKLLSAQWKIGADAGIAAGPFGRDASANTDWKMNSGILTYSRAKGVFAGATLNGANVRADEDSIKSFYGRPLNFRDLLSGKVVPPPAAHEFLAQIRQNFHEANAAK
jgi:lipid-binding SYLF domain-containing protein